jgi:hypothetical protein
LHAPPAHSGASGDDKQCELSHTRDCAHRTTTQIFFDSIEASHFATIHVACRLAATVVTLDVLCDSPARSQDTSLEQSKHVSATTRIGAVL